MPCELPKTANELKLDREWFMKYIKEVANPARRTAGLKPIDEFDAKECYEIILRFQMGWIRPEETP